jgi:hypothetical protein
VSRRVSGDQVTLVVVGAVVGALVVLGVVMLIQADQLQRREREFRETQYHYEDDDDG